MNFLYNSKALQSQIFIAINILMTCACESFVEINPPKTQSVSATVYADDASAKAAIRGIYHEMTLTGFASGQFSGVTVCASLSSDELKSFNLSLDEFYNNSISASSTIVNSNLWGSTYKYIYYSNSAIEGLEASVALTARTKKQLEGEAKFLRAFCYFYLVNLFGDVPLVLTTDYRKNSVCVRNAKDEVLQQVIKDLNESQLLLSADYQFADSERVRANAGAAMALLARVYLYTKDWSKSEQQSTLVINNSSLYKLVTDLNAVFLKNSNEAIWQLMPVVSSTNTYEAQYFVPTSPTSVPTFVSITNQLINAFEPGDKRKTNWIGIQTIAGNTFYYPFKYKVFKAGQPLTEYSMVLRLAEQYLIRAEARAMQNKLTEAIVDINVIRQRAGLAPIIATSSSSSVFSAIEQERKIVLFSEWGHRWFDLKRWNKADAVLQPLKPDWASTDVLYPLPQLELNNNPNLSPQNPGY